MRASLIRPSHIRAWPLLALAAGFASLHGIWNGSTILGVAGRLTLVAVACWWVSQTPSFAARRVAVASPVIATAIAIEAANGVRLAHLAAFPVAIVAFAAAGIAWWGDRGVSKRRPRWQRALLAVPIALFLVLPALAEAFVLATDGPTEALPANLPGAFIQTGNVNTHYEQWGTTGSPVVLVHGFLESTYVWSKSAPLLAASHRVFAYDTRGYGFTERRGPYTLDGDVTQLGDLIDALHLAGKPVLIGHSSGAAIITAFARLHPDKVTGIVLVDGDATPYGAGPGWAHSIIGEPLFTAMLRAGLGSDALIRSVLQRQCGPTCTIEPEKWRAPMRQPGAEDALLRILRHPLIGLEPAQIAEVRVPAAVMSGEFDSTMGPPEVAVTALLLHTDRTAVLKGEHHLPMLNSPDAFVAQLTPLLDGLSR